MIYRSMILCLLLLTVAVPALAAGDDAPDWLRQAATLKFPAYDNDVPAVVLRDESNMTVGEDGKVTKVMTYAVRILTREGRHLAVAREHYLTNGGKVHEMRAWLIRPTGVVKKYGKDETMDWAAGDNDVYNDTRYKAISAADDADAGTVFGYEIVSEERSFFNQDIWAFQGMVPVLSSRLSLTLPANWRASSVTFNHAKVEPVVNGSTYSWELRNLAPIRPEPASPEITNLAPRIAISYYPVEGTRSSAARSFDNWVEVSRWYTELSDPQAAPNDLLVSKAKQLTAGAKTELEKIQAIARYVQDVQYISIQIGIGGFRPHAATEVFAKSYGDCKDKANLMRTMLKAVNIQSYMVLIFAGDPTYVREEWASPKWFNHCIIAVKLSDESQAASVVKHPTLGRLLIFDATDDVTPLGDLPDHEQGSFALIAAGDSGSLMRMPITPPEANSMERQSEVVLDGEGAITATVQERSIGQTAVRERRMFRKLSRPDFVQAIERWIARGATGAKVNKITPTDNSLEGRFALDVEFTAGRYAQLMQDRLLVFRPAIMDTVGSLSLTEAKRQHPIVLEAFAYNETVTVKLPAGFEVDEVPDSTKLDTSFATFSTSYEVKDGNLLFRRSMVQRKSTIPVEDYAKVKSFFAGIRAAEQAPVVLSRK